MNRIKKFKNFSVRMQIKQKSQFEFVPRDTEESEFFDLEEFGGVPWFVDTVIARGGKEAVEIGCTRECVYT